MGDYLIQNRGPRNGVREMGNGKRGERITVQARVVVVKFCVSLPEVVI
jgi:hypothetical protein